MQEAKDAGLFEGTEKAGLPPSGIRNYDYITMNSLSNICASFPTVFARSLYQFHTVTPYIKWVKTS